MPINFDVLIDQSLLELGIGKGLAPVANKRLLSLINDYEDNNWRHDKFDQFIWDNVAETALTVKEREALQGQPHTLLASAAKNLRLTDAEDDIGKGSELAEIVLYGIMRHKYQALPVVPKIFYKQNTQDNAKGADSVHIVLGAEKDFSLWFGEAKFYNSIEDVRLNPIIASVKAALDTAKLKKENSIIVNLTELDRLQLNPEVCAAIKEALDHKHSIDDLKPRINVPILLLHECAITNAATAVTQAHKDAISTYHKDRAVAFFTKQIAALKEVVRYEDVRFHLILFPVPTKKPIVDRFVKWVTRYKE